MEDTLELIAAPVFRLYAERHGYTHISAGDPALRMALVERDGVATLKRTELGWNRPGVYVLIGPGDDGFDATVYVGKAADQGIAERIAQQVRDKDWWARALVVASAHEDGWSSADVGFLEGELHSIVTQRARLDVANKQVPRDGTLTSTRVWELRRFGPAVAAVLRVLGIGSVTLDVEVIDDTADEGVGAEEQTISRSNGLPWWQAAREVLAAQDDPSQPRTTREIVKLVFDAGLRDPGTARTPWDTLRRDLAQKAAETNPLFEQTAPATFRLTATALTAAAVS